MVKGKR